MEKLKAIERVEEAFAKLPSVGKKSAERMAYALLDMDEEALEEFSTAIKELKQQVIDDYFNGVDSFAGLANKYNILIHSY